MSKRLISIADLDSDWRWALPHVASLADYWDRFKTTDPPEGYHVHVPKGFEGSMVNTESHFAEFALGFDRQRSSGVHASEVSGCMRPIVYSLMKTERKKVPKEEGARCSFFPKSDKIGPANMQRRFDIGTAMHALIQSDLDRMLHPLSGKVQYQAENKISPELNELARKYDIHSHCDGVFTFYDNNWEPFLRVGVELKTMSDGQYDLLKQPKSEHLEQNTIYQKVLDVPLVWYIYVNKSNSNFTQPKSPWLRPFDQKLWETLERRIQHANELAAAGTLPVRTESMACAWCAFAWDCKPKCMQQPTYTRGLTVKDQI